jgi:hypothetical protein
MTVLYPGTGFPQDVEYGKKTSLIQAGFKMNHGAVVGIIRTGSFTTTSKKEVRGWIKKGFISVIHDSNAGVNLCT